MKEEALTILSKFNPWWQGKPIEDLPSWKRAKYEELKLWVFNPPSKRAVLLSGPRQVGKTTLILQAIEELLDQGISPKNILYISFDHPLFRAANPDDILEAWRELETKDEGPEYLFLDEAHFVTDFGTWVKHQVDFFKKRRIIFTGSATPLIEADQESGVGRWHSIRISTLSFHEYLKIKKLFFPHIPKVSSFSSLLECTKGELHKLSEGASELVGYFHEYLTKGGFPQTALVDSVTQAQRLLREDIIDKVLKRDLTTLFGVRRVLELEQTFIHLCMHDGGLYDPVNLSKSLGVSKPTIQNFIDLLECAHLVQRVPPFGYGKEIIRARQKIYLADPSIAPSILLKGKTLFEDPKAISQAVETAILSHLETLDPIKVSYWKGDKDKEVDFIFEAEGKVIPIEVKYQSQIKPKLHTEGLVQFCIPKRLQNLRFCQSERAKFNSLEAAPIQVNSCDAEGVKGGDAHEGKSQVLKSFGYNNHEMAIMITKSPKDIGLLPNTTFPILQIPAPLFCYMLEAFTA
ncbi:MAG: ATP-binding protein [Chlamydiia bacterium]|nr:ATP-binding protein [Chlamydiia bacterium]